MKNILLIFGVRPLICLKSNIKLVKSNDTSGKYDLEIGKSTSQTDDIIIKPGTASALFENATDYIGAGVNYGQGENGTEATKSVNWKIFDITSKNIYLIADNYINAEKYAQKAEGVSLSAFSVRYTSDRTALLNYLTNKNNWTNFAVTINGKTSIATGTPTIAEYLSSYNKINSNRQIHARGNNGYYIIRPDSEIGYSSASIENNPNNLYYGEDLGSIKSFWISSAYTEDTYSAFISTNSGRIEKIAANSYDIGVRPIIKLSPDVKLVKVQDNIYNLE